MNETRVVELRVRLPDSVALEVERLQDEDPEFLARVVLYGITRRSVYRHLDQRRPPPDFRQRQRGRLEDG